MLVELGLALLFFWLLPEAETEGVPERAASRVVRDEGAWERMDEVRIRYPHLWSEEDFRSHRYRQLVQPPAILMRDGLPLNAWERMDEVRTRYPHLWSEEAVRLREEAVRLQFETHVKHP